MDTNISDLVTSNPDIIKFIGGGGSAAITSFAYMFYNDSKKKDKKIDRLIGVIESQNEAMHAQSKIMDSHTVEIQESNEILSNIKSRMDDKYQQNIKIQEDILFFKMMFAKFDQILSGLKR